MRGLVAAVIALALLGILVSRGGSATARRCVASQAKAFAAIRDDPTFLVGTIPSSFTGDARYFTRRFNCLGLSAQVRRVGLGLYDVRFPGLRPGVVLATAISEEAVSASVHPLTDGVVRVALRGPLAGSDVASRRDVAFSLVVY